MSQSRGHAGKSSTQSVRAGRKSAAPGRMRAGSIHRSANRPTLVAAKATSTALDGSDIDALLAIARAPSLVDAERHAAFLRGLLGPEAPALEPLIDSLLERAGELERAKRLAALDALTGIANRRTFAEALRRELSRAERSGKPLSVILFDLDDFKAINDSFSHAAGDRALQLVARCAEGVTREGDLVARLGGDEFAVLLPETGERGAREIGERIRSRLAQASEDHNG